MKKKIAIFSTIIVCLFAGAFCRAYSTTTVKQFYSETCYCVDTQYYLGQGIVCEDWSCTGSTTEIVVLPETSVYATTATQTISVSFATTSTTTWNTNTNYVYTGAVVILLLVIIAFILAFRL